MSDQTPRTVNDRAATPKRSEAVTLETIAKRAGVHPSTVSRSLRRLPTDRAPSERSENIRRIAEELGYIPDRNAAALATARSSTIGVLVPRLTDLVLAEIYDAIEVEANRHGLDSFVVNTHDETREQLRRVRSLVARRVNGLILGDVYRVGTSLAAIEAFNVPFVLVNRSRRGYPSSTCDDQLGGHLVGSHLANMGHTEIGIISGGLHTSTAYDRVDGCRRALAERGIDIPESRIIALGFDVEAGRRGAAALLDSRNPPTAIFATNDFAAIGAMGVLRDKHLQAGRDVAVVGFNDISLCRDLAIPLTSVRSPHALIGRTAVDMLLKLLAGDECQSILHAPELIVRESSDPGTSTYSDGYGGDHKAPHDAPSK